MAYNKNKSRRNIDQAKAIAKAKEASAIRRRIKALLGNECFVCGYKDCPKALELHHVDRTKKKFNISMSVLKFKWPTLVKECIKCILVCNRCHVEVEEGIIEVKEKDIPKTYYKKLLDSLKPAKSRFKSKVYDKQTRGASSAAKSRKNYRRTPKKKP